VRAVNFPATYITDTTGQWVLPFGDSTQPIGAVTVRVTLPDGTTVDAANVCVARGRETRLGVTALGGAVQRAGRGVAGAVITVAGHPGQTVSREGGAWTYYFGPGPAPAAVDVTATLPDGASKTQTNVAVTPRATAPGPLFQFA
jgi:hypothetical protein